MWTPKGLDNFALMTLIVSPLLPSILSWFCSQPVFIQIFHGSSFSILLHLWLHSHNFTICPLMGTLPGLSNHLKYGWKPSWSHNSCILHTHKTSTMRMAPGSTASSHSVWQLLDHICRVLQVTGWWSTVKQIPRNHFSGGSISGMVPWRSFLKAKPFNFKPDVRRPGFC